MPEICADTVGLHVSYWLDTRWEMLLSGHHIYLGIFQSLSATLQTLLKGSQMLFRHFPKGPQCPLSTAQIVSKNFKVHFQTCLSIDSSISFTFPLKQHDSVY